MRAFLVAAFLLVASPARADHDGDEYITTAFLRVFEMLTPDLRFELEARPPVVLSWPVTFGPFRARHTGPDLRVLAFFEPQVRLHDGAARFVWGGRWAAAPRGEPWSVTVDTAALVGQDGSGALVGPGVCYGEEVEVCFVARFSFTDAGRRADVSLDFVVWSDPSP